MVSLSSASRIRSGRVRSLAGEGKVGASAVVVICGPPSGQTAKAASEMPAFLASSSRSGAGLAGGGARAFVELAAAVADHDKGAIVITLSPLSPRLRRRRAKVERGRRPPWGSALSQDRKSTRLNSSHDQI